MRQFFLVLGAVLVILAGVSPVKRSALTELRLVEVEQSSGALIKATAKRISPVVHATARADVVPASDLP